ncbi:MAG: methyltransferase domain-containing protein [Pseudomonadota bacterium]|nr:methyltransferase domain-containing protein [Pseudomonadota bacterium]
MVDKTLSESACSVGWGDYYEKTGQRPPRPTVMRALDAFDCVGLPEGAMAADLGCGSGRDLVEIHRRGWPVQAIDASPEAIDCLLHLENSIPSAQIYPQLARYEDMNLLPCDLINASFSLPLCPPENFSGVWQKILAALKAGGRFSGQLYGEHDSWFGREGMTFHTRTQIDGLLSELEVEFLEEEEDDSVTPRGASKHWHIFHIVAKKL